MHVPVIASLKEAANNAIADATNPAPETPEATEAETRPRTFRKYGRPSASRHEHFDASRAAPAEAEAEDLGIEERAMGCPRGKAFYRCANLFTGCCSHDPCNPGGSCRDSEKESTQKENTPTPTHLEGSTTHVTAHHPSRTHHHPHHPHHHHHHHTITATHHSEQHSQPHSMPDTSHSSVPSPSTHASSTKISSILSASPTSKSSPSTSPTTSTSGIPPPCPAANGTNFTDSAKIEYTIHCGVENTFISYNSIYVGTGGYAECFSACSKTNECAGFTFVGSDGSGNCYLKAQLPEDSYEKHGGINFTTCAKTNSPNNTGSGVTSSPKKAGIIAGAVIGGLILLGLLLFLIACCAKRHRKTVEKKRATITHVIQGPIEMQPYRPPTQPTHQRAGSTSHDAYPTGGDMQNVVDTAAETNAQVAAAKSSRLTGYEQTFRSDAEGGLRPESGLIPLKLSASVYKRSKGVARRNSPVLEGSSTAQPDSRTSDPRSPRSREAIDEQGGSPAPSHSPRGASTIDSPTLGQQQVYKSMAHEVLRNQHLHKTGKSGAIPSPKGSSAASPETQVDSDGYKWREL